jgi:surfeit locus 1 family protein
MKRRIWPVLVAATLGLVLLFSLGTWQVQRLAWKNGLIADLNRSLQAEAVPYETAQKSNFTKVKLSGAFASDQYQLVISTHEGGPAWTVVRPFKLTTGEVLLVNTGKAPSENPTLVAPSPIVAEALIETHAGYQGTFDPDNPPDSKTWYWWDVPAMAKKLGATEAGFVVSLQPNQPGTEGLVVEAPKANLRNNHLGYAITWFGLAAALLVVTGVFVFRKRDS